MEKNEGNIFKALQKKTDTEVISKIHKPFWDKLKTLRYLLFCDYLWGAELLHHLKLQALMASLLLQQK